MVSPSEQTQNNEVASGAPVSVVTTATARRRIDSIDLLRGIVMVIMMLDHTRDFVHRYVMQGFDPTDLAHTSVKLFFTRWITHFCAPIFVFLAGTGIYLQAARGKSRAELSRFLVTRGLWLIVLEFTAVRVAVTFNFDYRFLGIMQVIWVIGVSMIVLAALIHLPRWAVGTFGVVMIAAHNWFDRFHVPGSWRGPESAVPGSGAKLLMILHQAFEAFPIAAWPSPVVVVIYPLIPWVGVMAAGYSFGAIYGWQVERRRRFLFVTGALATALFIILRLINRYGDASHWSVQGSQAFTVLSFLNVTKYPPSLLFLLMTLGPALLALAFFEKSPRSSAAEDSEGEEQSISFAERIRNFFVTFGRVPLFFYLLQWPAAHFISVGAHATAGKPVRWMFGSQIGIDGPPPAGVGFNLAVVYVCWVAGVLMLYPLCKWFAGVKSRRRDWWLSYL
jgi:uncharacterized membrane protein